MMYPCSDKDTQYNPNRLELLSPLMLLNGQRYAAFELTLAPVLTPPISHSLFLTADVNK